MKMKATYKKALKKALAVLIITVVLFTAFVLLMCYLIACGVAAGYEIKI